MFLALPTEIRLQIYELVLICWRDKECILPDVSESRVTPLGFNNPKYTKIVPAVLQTCRQIYSEAIPILYSSNRFRFVGTTTASTFLVQIGPTNVKLLKSLSLGILPMSKVPVSDWLNLLDALVTKATGLRSLEVVWVQAGPPTWRLDGTHGTHGDNVLFVHALAKFRHLKELKIRGWYAKHWPSFLSEKLPGVQVVAVPGHSRANNGRPGINFEVLQRATEHLDPREYDPNDT
ncbi:hypothetical protein FQN57_001851 [Myotisia sp. PD_48]|nr:hypothetical protein FQN57_001851 [Myotisia sp. PD_48]